MKTEDAMNNARQPHSGMPVWYHSSTMGVVAADVTAVKTSPHPALSTLVDIEWDNPAGRWRDINIELIAIQANDSNTVGKCWIRKPDEKRCKGINCTSNGATPHSQECHDAHDRATGAGTLTEDGGFAKGDRVRLKSGGPEMVIAVSAESTESTRAKCAFWNEGSHSFDTVEFSLLLLVNLDRRDKKESASSDGDKPLRMLSPLMMPVELRDRITSIAERHCVVTDRVLTMALDVYERENVF